MSGALVPGTVGFAPNGPATLQFGVGGPGGGIVLTITPDRRIVVADGVTVDEAARGFLFALETMIDLGLVDTDKLKAEVLEEIGRTWVEEHGSSERGLEKAMETVERCWPSLVEKARRR